MNASKFSPALLTLIAVLLVIVFGGNFASAQSNDKRALRNASGTYKGTEALTKGGAPIATGKAKVKPKEKGKTTRPKLIEDAPSTITHAVKSKVQKADVRRDGKMIVGKARGSSNESMAGTFFSRFVGNGSGTAKQRGSKFVGEAKVKTDGGFFGPPLLHFFKGKG